MAWKRSAEGAELRLDLANPRPRPPRGLGPFGPDQSLLGGFRGGR